MPVAHVQHRPKRSVDVEVRSTKRSVGIMVIKNRQRYHSDLYITALGGIYNSRIHICEGLNSYRHSLCNIPKARENHEIVS